jgi:transcriptional regulator with XRE-family HTH domain
MLLHFGDKLRYLRQQRGLTQKQLADQLLLASHAHVANLEARRDTPSLELVIAIAQLLNVSTDYLLRDKLPVEDSGLHSSAPKRDTNTFAEFGNRLRLLRTHLGIRQIDLARQLGISNAYLNNVEANRKGPSLDLVVKIANSFNMPTDHLLFGIHDASDSGF